MLATQSWRFFHCAAVRGLLWGARETDEGPARPNTGDFGPESAIEVTPGHVLGVSLQLPIRN